ncbi:polyamine-transporting ATPase 13A3 [Macrosteles quadrilineatus]|uniref:polyamine-transporting ATPase 13A3 n=1 Tax=Macrosteles quadrilineatus TaxID=74068 RepID=UPI0023E2C157|nr:polyamine-transporting ATPase 13A3 [Macrosteles quadrilineatus]
MPSTPSHLKIGFQRNTYSRVSFGKNIQEQERKKEKSPDIEPLNGGKSDHDGILPGVDYINLGTEDQMEVYGYRRHTVSTGVSWLFIILTLGAVRLVFHWWPHLMLFATHYRCPLSMADKLLIVERYKKKHKCYHVKTIKTLSAETLLKESQNNENNLKDKIGGEALLELIKMPDRKLPIHMSGGTFVEMESVRMFECKKQRYIWDEEKGEFFKLAGLDCDVSTSALHQQTGLSPSQQLLRRLVYGSNEIIVPMRGVIALLFLEVLNPFYVFQLFSFALWFADNYVYYAVAILTMSAVSIIMTVIQTRNNQNKLHSTIHSSDVVSVLQLSSSTKEPVVTTIPTEQLVPGDLMVIPTHGCIMHCDAVLLTGNCIVNESMLTGESVPVTKTPLPNSANIQYDDKEHARHTLFCGTHVIQTRYYGHERVYAVVIRTGFSTAKGNLVRSILYPTPVDFKFEQDSYKFVQLLAVIASVGFLYTVVTKAMRGVPVRDIALEALDLITIVVPPALPAAMTVGRMYAQSRLKKNNIYCISPRTINVSGSINCVCFDKTGTLTEDGLDMWGVVPSESCHFKVPVKQLDTLPTGDLLYAMATCHSLTIIDSKISGDPLDLKMFESTGWILEEPDVSDDTKFDLISPTVVRPPKKPSQEGCQELGIIRQFPFSSSLQRMSVITRQLGGTHFTIYSKGSPEMIQGLCRPDTIPTDFSRQLEEYTQEGYRVLGVAYRDLPSRVSYPKMQRLSREEVETDLCFLGLVVLENRLKPQTNGVIAVLRAANIRTIMVTGDNVLTALSVARDCGIIPPGRRVITVNSTAAHNGSPPQLYYMQTQHNITSPTDTIHTIFNESQMTGTFSMMSIDTLESGTVTLNNNIPNGSAHNSVMTDLEMPVDNNICGPEDTASITNYSLAMTGATWSVIRTHYPELVPRIATRGAVFSRMSPDQKQQLIQTLQSLGYYVAMCGDGANDCGALKAAHAGISLSEAESSVASPFTSKDPNIECVVKVIREGRAALVTSFGIFKYMAAYSLTQFISVMILYSIDSNLTDKQYLYIDLFIITTFAFLLGRTEAYPGPLVPLAPQTSLMSLAPIVSLIGQMAVVMALQFISFFSVQKFDWFVPYNATKAELEGVGSACYENYALFAISSMQYVILAVVFSKGAPYRLPLYKNWTLLASVTGITVFTFYLIIGPHQWVQEQFELIVPPEMDFRIFSVVMCGVNFVLAGIHEFFICDYLIFYKLRARRKETSVKKKYMNVEHELRASPQWPPLCGEPPSCVEAPPQRPERSPATVTITAFPFTNVNGQTVNHEPPTQLQTFSMSGDTIVNIESGKRVREISNGVATIPRCVSLSKTEPQSQSCQSVAQVHQSEDSLSRYLTPPESPLHYTS